jgi:hypothetical protein
MKKASPGGMLFFIIPFAWKDPRPAFDRSGELFIGLLFS